MGNIMKNLFILLLVTSSFNFISYANNNYTKDELDTAKSYYNNELKTTPFAHEFRASEQQDVPAIKDFSKEKRQELLQKALDSIAANQGVIAILAAGASTRMNPLEAPQTVKKILGDKDIKSKASVPLGVLNNKPVTFLGAFLTNISRLQSQLSELLHKNINLKVLILSNDDYRTELDEQLEEHNNYGLNANQLVIFHQQLGNQMIATPKDAQRASEKLENPDDKQEALEISEKAQKDFENNNIEALMLKGEKAPLGHGEFLHQLISSGTFLKLYDDGRQWISIRNIDNSAATFDENWLVTLGNFLEQKLDMQPEVSPRTEGQKGGSLIISGEQQILAEDPQIEVSTDKNTKPDAISYWFNNAVALMSMNYIIDIYKKAGQSPKAFIAELRHANQEQLDQIALRGRKKFPVLMDPKPAKTSKAIAMKVETNLWQSTGIVSPEVKIKAIGVEGIFNIKDKFEALKDPKDRAELVKDLRFLATKQWEGPSESYEANKAYIDYLLEKIYNSRLVSKKI
jgi:hypothetical protein